MRPAAARSAAGAGRRGAMADGAAVIIVSDAMFALAHWPLVLSQGLQQEGAAGRLARRIGCAMLLHLMLRELA